MQILNNEVEKSLLDGGNNGWYNFPFFYSQWIGIILIPKLILFHFFLLCYTAPVIYWLNHFTLKNKLVFISKQLLIHVWLKVVLQVCM